MTDESQHPDDATDMELFDLRVTVERIEGRSFCGMRVGDYFELVNSAELRLPPGRHFCIWRCRRCCQHCPPSNASSRWGTGWSETRSSAAPIRRKDWSCALSGQACAD